MYVNTLTMKFGVTTQIYDSIEEFNGWQVTKVIKGLYKLGDYKKTKGPRPEPA